MAVGSLVGQVVSGTVTGIAHFGAFVALEAGGTGLIHVSEIAHAYVRDVREHVTVNDRVEVKVLRWNPANGKYDLSLRQAGPVPPEPATRWPARGSRQKALAEGSDPAFEQKLSKFLKASDERLTDVKRNLESKRGRGYR